MATSIAGAGLISSPLALFGTASARRRPAALVAVNAERKLNHSNGKAVTSGAMEEEQEVKRSWRDYFELAKLFIGSDGGPPRWFSPLETGKRMHNSPLLLYLPGIDGLGCGLVLQHQNLGKIFDVWCLHIPVKDRTPFQELVLLVEETVRSENLRSHEKPIYLVGESIGGCVALAVAARNPDIDLVLILANPATCYSKSNLLLLFPLLKIIPNYISLISIRNMLGLMTGEPFNLISSSVEKGLERQATLEQLSQGLGDLLSYLSSQVLADILPRETLLWKLQMMKSACSFANSRLHAVKAQILILVSERDQLLPSLEEAERIREALPKQEIRVLKNTGKMPKCEIRYFKDSGHFLFLEDGVDIVTIIKGTSLYRCGKFHDYLSDYLPPTDAEFKKLSDPFRWLDIATGLVMLSTLENGKIVRGLAGIPSEGPVLLVGNHMLLGLDLYPIVINFMKKRNIILRGLAHPLFFVKLQEDVLDISMFDPFRIMGAVPVSASNIYKLLSSGSHILLYPGGVREALHDKGEEYQLFWPERSEFVRMASSFGAKIIPFGVIGEDDVCEILLDSEDQMKIPYLREAIEKRTSQIQLRTDLEGEVANQITYFPGVVPKLPGRFYYMFGKPIDTAGMKQELRDKEKAHEVYLQVKSEVERCISYLKEKREKDPYRSLAARTLYQTMHGSEADVPTFEH
ncbi:acyltransferase-like protein At3g26840, chloroplastic [Chenopodium quinoa]|uniref:acyltransferase-like protein At3g26840, chloroplastic n=1 Tax=Chenopodium quinoa TaxID=63459 RepID=UPI000B77B13E|nr:acyltransferase-like protein At3g26840, chloroplastic [Chenopodium quinoa]